MTMDDNERYMLWLGIAGGSGAARARKLLEAYDDDPKNVFDAAASGELYEHVKTEIAERMKKQATERFIDRCVQRLDSIGVKYVTLASEGYPSLLREIYDPPAVLYYKGTLYDDLQLPIAVVGTREPSDYGKRVAEKLAGELAIAGACVISGMAYGIDCISAQAALAQAACPYPTIAVLGCGVDVIYPETNRDIYQAIIERGAVVSEYMPGTEPRSCNFPMRNRLISGLSRGVVVVEAPEKSGALITADCALEQGRELFAVPGRITDQKSEGTNKLIRGGMAKAVLTVGDILEEFGMAEREEERVPADTESMSFEEELIYRLLVPGERSFDELCVLTGLTASSLNSTLTALEFSGIIKQSPGRLYSL